MPRYHPHQARDRYLLIGLCVPPGAWSLSYVDVRVLELFTPQSWNACVLGSGGRWRRPLLGGDTGRGLTRCGWLCRPRQGAQSSPGRCVDRQSGPSGWQVCRITGTQHRLWFGVNDIGEPPSVSSQQGLDLNHTGNHRGAGRPMGREDSHLGDRWWVVWGRGTEEGEESKTGDALVRCL